MSTTTTVEILLADDSVERTEMMAVAGFLAGYCGSTGTSYATDLRLFATWCHEGGLTLFSVRRAHLELFGRWMEESGPGISGCRPTALHLRGRGGTARSRGRGRH